MHNMIIEEEVETYGSIVDFNLMFILKVDMIVDKIEQFQQFLIRHKQIKDKEAYYTLQNALIEHL